MQHSDHVVLHDGAPTADQVHLSYNAPRPNCDEQRMAWANQNLEILRDPNTRSMFSVAAGACVTLPNGTQLTPGMAVDVAAHLGGSMRAATELAAKHVLLEMDPRALAARTCSARYRVGPKMLHGTQGVMLRTGVKSVGDGVVIADFAREALTARVDTQTGLKLEGRPAFDGVERFAELLQDGSIIDHGPEFGPRYDGKPEPAGKGKAA